MAVSPDHGLADPALSCGKHLVMLAGMPASITA
jgi:hypothetical protein